MNTETALREFLLSCTTLMPYTQECYRRHLNFFLVAFPNELPASPQPIQAWLAGIDREPATRRAYHATVRAMYNQLQRWHPSLENPMSLVRVPRLRDKVRRTFSPEELHLVFIQPLTPRDRALLTLLLDNGVRAVEVIGLTWEGVMPEYIVVTGKGGRERPVSISPYTYRQLMALVPSDNHAPGWERRHVFTGKRGPLTRQGIYKLVKRCCLRAGLTGRRLAPHTLRHTFATLYAENPACSPKELQKIMGHRDFKTTLRYIQSTRTSMIRNHRLCTPLKQVAAAAQGILLPEAVLQEAEEILIGRESG